MKTSVECLKKENYALILKMKVENEVRSETRQTTTVECTSGPWFVSAVRSSHLLLQSKW